MESEGRHWYNLGRLHIRLEYNLLKRARFCHAEIELNAIDGCSGIQFKLAIPYLFAVWLTISHPITDNLLPTKRTKSYTRKGEYWDMPLHKVIGVSWHDGTLWWKLWETWGEWSHSQPWWWSGSFSPANFFLGHWEYSEKDVVEGEGTFPMPEGDYHMFTKSYTAVWKRPRWGREEKVERVEMEFNPPIPIPGKGESAWDLEDNHIFSTTVPAETTADAIDYKVKSILETRKRYGGAGWIPSEGWEV